VPDSLLTILKVIFLGLLYLFFLRVLRAVWTELREPNPVQVAADAPGPAQPEPAPRGRGRRRRRQDSECLVVLQPANRNGQVFELGDELTVGRALGCGVALTDDTFVSQLHARVFRHNGSLYIEDLGSTNGTFLNRKQVSGATPLRKGDRLQVGKTILELSR
jgi:hypothetical protein